MAAKFAGVIGYSMEAVEVSPGVFDDVIVERKYYGDVIRTGSNVRVGENVLPDLDITNQFSILADAFASENLFAMRYIHWAGTNWTIKQLEFQRPRLIVRVGGVYNGPTFEASDSSGEPDEGADPIVTG